MKKFLPIVFAIPLLLSACSGSEDSTPAPSSAVSSSVSSIASATSSPSSSSTTTTATSEPAPVHAPAIDQLVITANAINGHGVYLDPDNGTYYYCNTTDYVWANVAAGTCDGPYDYDGASAKFYEAGEDWYDQSVTDLGLKESELDANPSPYPDSPEKAVFNSCWENGYAQFTDGSVRPYADCELPSVKQTPSPWVQGQIDWANCLDAGNTDEACRETLN